MQEYQIVKFDGSKIEVAEDQFKQVVPLLLKTGKFVLINGEVVNISDIKTVRKAKNGLYNSHKPFTV